MYCPMCGHDVSKIVSQRVAVILAVFLGLAIVILAIGIPCFLWAESWHQRDTELAEMGLKVVFKREDGRTQTDVVPIEWEIE